MIAEYDKIDQLIQLRRFQLARNELITAFKNHPTSPELFYLQAVVDWYEDKIDAGIEAAQQGLSTAPEDVDLRWIYFKLLENNKAYADAELIIIELIREHPSDADYHKDYAHLMLFTFNIEKARALINEALRISPNHHDARFMDILISIVEGNQSYSSEQLATLIREDPENEDFIGLLIVSLIDKRQYDAALQLSQELLRIDPSDQDLVDSIVELRAVTHWSAWPLRPIHRFGWGASIVMWVGVVTLLQLNKQYSWPWLGAFIYIYLGYVIYSWIHGPILQRLLNWRGV